MVNNKQKQKGDKGRAADLFSPTEYSVEEYNQLVQQIRDEFSAPECEEEMLTASRYGDIDVVRAILQIHRQLHKCKDDQGSTPLHKAAANGHVSTVDLLLKVGADPSVTNAAGNTPLHWASANGQEKTVELLLKQQNIDVLQQNKFGRSALTEGFSSEKTEVVKSLLEHNSATEERLVQGTNVSGGDEEGENSPKSSEITHDLVFQGIEFHARELAIAESDKDTILGQANPADDTTGLGIWAASIVLAQWLVEKVKDGSMGGEKEERIVELGAGCGIPSLALATALSAQNETAKQSAQIYATDFNPRTVENLQHNIHLNEKKLNEATQLTGMVMDWKDPSTWPKEPVDCVIGSDLIYQSDMVPLLVNTITGLIKAKGAGKFLYVARADGERQGHVEFMDRMEAAGFEKSEVKAPEVFTHANPLASQDDDLCFLHFNELKSLEYKLFEFYRSKE